jgi:uncharacterized protein (TIGR02452 family)
MEEPKFKSMSSKAQTRDVAEDTLEVLENERYTVKGKTVDLKKEITFCKENTVLIRPDDSLNHSVPQGKFKTNITIQQSTTLEAAQKLAEAKPDSDLFVLNFASAKRPGGGFLGGAKAQEESIARSSALYHCLLTQPDYYSANARDKTLIYTHHFIYSPDVPVFKNDKGQYLIPYYKASILSAPAPNRKAISRIGGGSDAEEKYKKAFLKRMDRLLAVACKYNHTRLVLGAWGCGVFGNSPMEVAMMFKGLLLGRYSGCFDEVVFAVLDLNTCKVFANAFNSEFVEQSTEWIKQQEKVNSYSDFNKKAIKNGLSGPQTKEAKGSKMEYQPKPYVKSQRKKNSSDKYSKNLFNHDE